MQIVCINFFSYGINLMKVQARINKNDVKRLRHKSIIFDDALGFLNLYFVIYVCLYLIFIS